MISIDWIIRLTEFETLNYNVKVAFICIKTDMRDCELEFVRVPRDSLKNL